MRKRILCPTKGIQNVSGVLSENVLKETESRGGRYGAGREQQRSSSRQGLVGSFDRQAGWPKAGGYFTSPVSPATPPFPLLNAAWGTAQKQNQCFVPVGYVIRISPFRKCKWKICFWAHFSVKMQYWIHLNSTAAQKAITRQPTNTSPVPAPAHTPLPLLWLVGIHCKKK